MTRARWWHVVTAVVATFALVLQLVLVWRGHSVLLRGLVDLDGADLLTDNLLHVVVPMLAVVGWIAFGPRGRVRGRDVLLALVLPIGWLAYTLVRGAFTSFYPYPFLDAGVEGYAAVAGTCVAISASFVMLAALAWKFDARLRPNPRGDLATSELGLPD